MSSPRSAPAFRRPNISSSPGSSVELYHGVLGGYLDAALIIRPPFPIPKTLGWQTLRREPLLLLTPVTLAVDGIDATICEQPFIRSFRDIPPTPELKSSCDMVIVGGDAHGLAAAYYFSTVYGITNVAVLEKGYLADGTPPQQHHHPLQLHD